MKILVVGLTTHPQIKRLQEEGQKRGHVVEGAFTSELTVVTARDRFEVSLRDKDIDHDLIYLWAVGKRRWEWYTVCDFLNEKKGTIIVNQKSIAAGYKYFSTSLSDFLKQYKENLPFPKSAVISSTKSIKSILSEFEFPAVVKSSTGHQGRAVFLVESFNELKNKVGEILDDAPCAIIRGFIPNDGDIRIFTVGYKAIGAMKRIPTKKGEFRSNISVGGRGENFDLIKYPEVRELAEKLSEITRTEIAGVDIVQDINTGKPYILEINPGPQYMGLEKYTGVNAALAIIQYFEELYSRNG